MTHTNRGRLSVNLAGPWRWYIQTIPVGCQVLGTVSRNGSMCEIGALLQTGIGAYVLAIGGVIQSLPQSKVQGAIDAARK